MERRRSSFQRLFFFLGDSFPWGTEFRWYVVKAVLDVELCKVFQCGKADVGTKLFICGAVLIPNVDGIEPSAVEEDELRNAKLQLSFNAVRRAASRAVLGFRR